MCICGETGESRVVGRGKNGTDGFRRAALVANPVVEIRRKETRLVPHVVTVTSSSACGKKEIEALLKSGCSSVYLDESANVLRNVERICPSRRLVEIVLVPGANEMRNEVFLPSSIIMAHPDEALHIASLCMVHGVSIPQFLPVLRACHKLLRVGLVMQSLRHQCDGIVVCGVLHRARARPIGTPGWIGVPDGQIPNALPLLHIAPAVAYGIARLRIGIMHHRPIASRPVQPWKMLYECVGEHHLGIRPALGSTGEVAGPAIREEAVMVLNLQQRLQDAGNSFWIEQCQQRSGRSERIPNAVEIVIVRRRALPQWVLARAGPCH